MKKTGLLMMAAVFAAATVFTSCKKEKPTPPGPGPAPEKTCVVSKTFDANSKLKEEYLYINDKLDKINSYDSTGMNVESKTQISYDASGNVSKVEYLDEKGEVTSTQAYEYNPSGTIGKVTISSPGQTGAVLNFEYNGTDPKKVSRVRITADLMGTPMEVAYADYTYDSKGNNTQSVTYILDFNGGGGFQKSSTVNYTFDDKKSATQNLAAIMLSPAYSGPNNILTETTINHEDGSQTTITYAYEYNNEKYPSKSTQTDDKGASEITSVEYNCK